MDVGKQPVFYLILAATAFMGGCSTLSNVMKAKPEAKALTPALDATETVATAVDTVRVDGRLAIVGDSQHRSLPEGQFASHVAMLLSEDRTQSAKAFTQLHCDTATMMLDQRWCCPEGSDGRVLNFVASCIDQTTRVNAAFGYGSLLALGLAPDATAQRYAIVRGEYYSLLQGEHTDSTTDEVSLSAKLISAADALQHPMPQCEARRMVALKHMLDGKAEEALQQMVQAATLAESGQQLQAASRCWLSVCDFARRAGDSAMEEQAWERATDANLELYQRGSGLFDIEFWITADQVRPSASAWPARCNELLLTADEVIPAASTIDTTASPEFAVQLAIVVGLIDRGDAQPALVHAKTATGLAPDLLKPWLRIIEAKCLVAIGAQPAAKAMLMGIEKNASPQLKAASLAALGSIQLSSGSFQQGHQTLQRAFAEFTTADGDQPREVVASDKLGWPGSTTALADYAVAQLIVGEIEAGLANLRVAQQRFLSSSQHAPASRLQYVQMLENELRFCTAEERSEEAEAARLRIREFESVDQQLAAANAN